MDCKAARLFLSFPGELAGPEAGALAEHLATCSECDSANRAEARFEARLGKAMRDVPLPAGIKQRLDARLARGRDALRRQRVARWLAPFAATAALLLCVGLVAKVWPRQAIDPSHVQAMHNVHPVRSADEADEAFAALGYPGAAPRFVDYSCLVGFPSKASLPGYPGRFVPVLEFAKGGRRAFVLGIDHNRFEPDDKLDPSGSGDYRADLHRVAGSRWSFLILHTGENWNWLWQRPVDD